MPAWLKPWTWRADPKWSVLSGMPTVQIKLLELVFLDILTFWATYHAIDTILHDPKAAQQIIVELLAIWYGLLGGMHGLGYKAYVTKRNTSWDGNVEEDRGRPQNHVERAVVDPTMLTQEHQAGTMARDGEQPPVVTRSVVTVQPIDPPPPPRVPSD